MDRKRWKKEFLDRLARHEDELRWLYLELYKGDVQAYEYFVEMLCRMYEERSETLKKIDRQREKNPDWYKGHDLVGMLMYVGPFAGTLAGVREKLDYIEESGVN